MTPRLPKWATDLAIVTLIFTVGGYATRLELVITSMNEDIDQLDKKVAVLNTAISIHHGPDWSKRMDELRRVEDLEETITGITAAFEDKVGNLGTSFNSTVKNLDDLNRKVEAVDRWTQQGDFLIERSRLDRFRALANYSTRNTHDPTLVSVNKAHRMGRNFKIGDSLILENPANGRSVEAKVKSLLDEPEKSEILVQLSQDLLPDLELAATDGLYELFIQGKPEALRWKSLDQIYAELSQSDGG